MRCLLPRLVTLSISLLLLALNKVKAADDDDKEHVNISIQVSFMAIPYYIGVDKGYYDELGIHTTTIVYPSGAPQVKAAVNEKAWDIGVAGVVPNVIGGAQGLLGIGICFDQSAINQLVANAAGVAIWESEPASFDGVKIALSPNSTGDFVVQACLKENGFALDKIDWVYEQQAGVIEALNPTVDANGTEIPPVANFGGLWAPNTYKFLENSPGSAMLCNGATVYATVTGGFMVRDEFAKNKPDLVNKVMAAWLRGIVFVKDPANREEVFDYMDRFYKEHNLPLSRSAMEDDMRLIGLYDLDGQLEVMKRIGTPPSSNYDFTTREISEFMLQNGVVSSYAEPADYITDEFFQNIAKDPFLAAFARGQDADAAAPTTPGGGDGAGDTVPTSENGDGGGGDGDGDDSGATTMTFPTTAGFSALATMLIGTMMLTFTDGFW